MPIPIISQVRQALSRLNPEEIRAQAERPLRVLLVADHPSSYAAMEDWLLPAAVSTERRMEVSKDLVRECDPGAGGRFHLVFHERGALPPESWVAGKDAFAFDPLHPERFAEVVLEAREDYALALARLFPPFRAAVAEKAIFKTSKENALFSLVTALPNVVPSLAELPWVVGEFASDTAVLTANQISMAFTLAAANGRAVGFKDQRNEIGSILAGAWGWRTVARELVSKVPFGGGLIPKAAIAFAGTFVVGQTLDRIYRIGYGMSADERAEAYEHALGRGKSVAAALLKRLRGGGEG
jgi:uncharacterized protein (DUF697 family)